MAIIYPTFQPQNPALNGYSLGWKSCTAYSGAMAASFDRQVKKLMTGEALRRRTGDTVGGLTLAQIDKALNAYWGVDLSVYYRLPWSTFAAMIDRGMSAVLQGWYGPIADSRFDAGRGFRGNHAVTVPPNWGTLDPLADGRYGQAYKYAGEPYPRALLRNFAGKLNLDPNGYRALGDGYVYAAMTLDRVNTYALKFTGGAFWVYRLGSDGRIIPGKKGRYAKSFSGPTSAPCGAGKRYDWDTTPGVAGGVVSKVLVRVLKGGLEGEYVGIPQSTVTLVTIP